MTEPNKKVTRKKAIETQCWHCMGFYADGRQDCENRTCPLYEFMPYRKLKPDYNLFAFNPKRVGKVTHEECTRQMTDEQREQQRERIEKMHESRRAKKND